MQMPPGPARKVACREILETDHAAVSNLLALGFPGRSFAYWHRGLQRLKARGLPPDVPRYGYLLECDRRVVGALLLIYSDVRRPSGEVCVRCNLSSWFVDPAFRSYATLLTSIAQKSRSVTFVNLTPAPNTWPIVEAQGFRTSGTGLFFTCPSLTGAREGRVEVVDAQTIALDGLSESDRDRMQRHVALGCLGLVCQTDQGPVPFLLKPFRIRKGRIPVPAMQLIYAPSIEDYRRCAAALGRFLLKRGRFFVVLNAEGPIAGLRGIFTTRRGRRYVRGPNPPGLCDLTDSELVMF